MNIIPTRIHGILDYVVAAVFLLPLVGGYEGGMTTLIPSLLGLSIIVYSLITNYEYGFVKLLSMRAHLVLDFLGGALLLVSPWLFEIEEGKKLWFYIAGAFEIVASLITSSRPSARADEAESEYNRRMEGAKNR